MRTRLVLAISCALIGCKGKSGQAGDGGTDASASARASSSGRSHLVRDPEGHLVPSRPRPEDDPASIPPTPGSAPSWDLDKSDPARDYVDRYVRATKRYGAATACVVAKVNGSRDGKAIVEVRDAEKPPAPCPPSSAGSAPRDAFLVDVDRDRLELAKGGALAKWPDGTDPAGPPGPPVEADAPPAKLTDALFAAKLTPVRTQLYGRGSYAVLTLAGWHDPVTLNAAPASLGAFVEKTCAANDGLPFGLFAGIDRATMLRVRCGAAPAARWDRL
jgi:hypothetical protein